MTISCSTISFSFSEAGKKRVIFDRMTASFDAGLFHAVMGPSGSGKTTLLNLLDGSLQPDSGVIELAGKPLGDWVNTELRREMLSRVYQDYRLIPYLTALDNVRLAQQVAGKLRDNPNRASDLLQRLGLAEQLDSLAESLSGGESQRVAIARALVNSQRIVLADEPTGALDENSSTDIAELLRDLAHELGVCIITVTHDESVANVADVIYRVHGYALTRVKG